MPPEESSNQPSAQGRQPYPRSRVSDEYMSVRRPVMPRNPARPYTPPQQSESAQPQPVELPAPQPAAPQQVPQQVPRPAAPTPRPEITPPPNYKPPFQTAMQQPPAVPVLPTVADQPVSVAEPKQKKRIKLKNFKKFVPVLAVTLLLVLAGVFLFAIVQWQSKRNDPDVVFKDALKSALEVQSLEVDQSGGEGTQAVSYDFSNLKSITTSNQATFKISGAEYGLNAYGTMKNTYISYSKLPVGIDTALAATVQNGWVQLRSEGQQPATVSAALTSLADPRSQTVGPVLFGNFASKEQTELVNYLVSQKVYSYDVTKVHGATFKNEKVKAYPVKLNVGFLRIAAQSAANAEGLSPVDIQSATSALDSLKDASLTIYVGKGNRFVGLDVTSGSTTKTYAYTKVNAATLANEPQTRLSWNSFAPYQWQMSAQAASKIDAAVRDKERVTKLDTLHRYFANYYEVNGSYPPFTNLNNPVWAASNLATIDSETFRDPQGMSLLLASAPQPNSFSYQPVGNNPKVPCDGSAANPCVHYKLTAIVAGNKPASVQDP